MQAEARRTYADLSRAGFHVLAIARKSANPDQKTLSAGDERNLVLCGFVAFLDPPDPTAIAAVAALANSGVGMKILTGDGELVTRTICERVGLRTDRVVLGIEVESMSYDALVAIVVHVDIVERTSPYSKIC